MKAKVFQVYFRALNSPNSTNLIISSNKYLMSELCNNPVIASLFSYKIIHSARSLKLDNGAKIIFSTGHDVESLKGQTLECVYIDEFNHIKDPDYIIRDILNLCRFKKCLVGEVV